MRRLLRILAWMFGGFVVLIAGCVAHANYRIAKDETMPFDAHAPGRYFDVRGHRLHVRTIGDVQAASASPPLMLVHGFILAADYEPFDGTLLRAGADAWQFIFLPFAHLSFIIGLVWVYVRTPIGGSAADKPGR